LKSAKIPAVTVSGPVAMGTVGGVSITSLNPETASASKLNNRSIVLRLVFGKSSFLFTGDIEAGAEHALIAGSNELHSTVLKVPHHGSKTSSTAQFIAAVHPEVAVISDGYLNRFHFPSEQVLDRYAESGATVLRTDLDGAVTIEATPDDAHLRTYASGRAASIPISVPAQALGAR
jgi:competence protein ComEC